MNSLIQNLQSSNLLSAMVSNLAAFWSAYGRGNGCTLGSTAHVTWFYTGIQAAICNGVIAAKLHASDVKVIAERLQARIDELGAPALWWLGPESNTDPIGPLLEQYGLQHMGQTPGMSIDLDMLNPNLKPVDHFVVEKVNGPEMQALWARVAAIGSGFSDTAADQMAHMEASLTDAAYLAQYRYLGYLEGTPVAASAMVLDSGVAGLYAVATLPEARRKGIGEFMTVMPLLAARQAGYAVGVLQASSMGYPVYKKIGFNEVCKFSIYLQSKKAA